MTNGALFAATGVLLGTVVIVSTLAVLIPSYFSNTADVTQSLNAQLPEPVAWWKFDETSGTDGANLVTNPGFETYTTSPGAPDGWTDDSGSSATFTRETSITHSGSNALKIVTTVAGVYQAGAGIPGITGSKSYYVETYARTGGAPNELAALLVYNIDDVVIVATASGTASTVSYEKLSVTFKADAGKTYRVYLQENGAADPATVYFDDVLVKEIQAKDASGTNHGTLSGATNAAGPTIGAAARTGVTGTAYAIDGLDDYIRVPDNAVLESSTFTATAWVYIDEYEPQNMFIFNKIGWVVAVNALTHAPGFAVQQSGGGDDATGSVHVLALDTWYFIAVKLEGSNARCISVDAEPWVCETPNSPMPATADDLYLGNSDVASGGIRPWNGQLDDLRIYGAGLNDAQLRLLFAGREAVVPGVDSAIPAALGTFLALAAIVSVAVFATFAVRGRSN